ncbi:MAG: hypothetical protein IKA64_05345 [Clostridia bacterium]|nr:hypothetical protein [Clostridia bacterium]
MKKMRRLTSFVLVLALIAAVLASMPADTALAAEAGNSEYPTPDAALAETATSDTRVRRITDTTSPTEYSTA